MFQYLYGNAVGVPETGAVTFGKDCVGNLHFAFDHEQVNAVLLAMQFVFLHQSRIQRTHREPGILVDGSRGGAGAEPSGAIITPNSFFFRTGRIS